MSSPQPLDSLPPLTVSRTRRVLLSKSLVCLPITCQASSPAWQQHAEQLRLALASLAPTERRRILDYISLPPEPPQRLRYSATACLGARKRVAELLGVHPKWTQARARRETARELGVSTVVLRRMLAQPLL